MTRFEYPPIHLFWQTSCKHRQKHPKTDFMNHVLLLACMSKRRFATLHIMYFIKKWKYYESQFLPSTLGMHVKVTFCKTSIVWITPAFAQTPCAHVRRGIVLKSSQAHCETCCYETFFCETHVRALEGKRIARHNANIVIRRFYESHFSSKHHVCTWKLLSAKLCFEEPTLWITFGFPRTQSMHIENTFCQRRYVHVSWVFMTNDLMYHNFLFTHTHTMSASEGWLRGAWIYDDICVFSRSNLSNNFINGLKPPIH